MKNTLFACAAILALHGAAFAGGEGWSHDFEAAKKQAASEKKDLLMDFTGSDWCGWCIKLNDEVFKHEPFKAGVKDTFVLVELDYPKDKSKLSEETQKQNDELRDKYAIQGYPTILLCDSEGLPYAATGYQKGGPEKYVSHLNELRGNKAKRDEAFAKAEKAEGVDKAKALMAGLEAMGLDEGLVNNFYGKIAGEIKAADPKDETGFKKKEETKARFTAFQTQLQETAQGGDMDAALALVDKTLKEGGFAKEETLQIMMTRAMIFAQQKKFDEAIKAVDEAKAFAPDSPMMGGIDQFRARLEKEKNKPAGEKDKEGGE
jgi:thioredoxin-related protein